MIRTNDRMPLRRRGKIAVALFAATAVLAGGAQALAPAPAAALQAEKCSDEWDLVMAQCSYADTGDNPGGGGGGSGSGAGLGDSAATPCLADKVISRSSFGPVGRSSSGPRMSQRRSMR